MSVPFVLTAIALVFGLIEEFKARGVSLLAWAVVLLCVALLWGHIA